MFAEGGSLCSIRPSVDEKTEHCFCVGALSCIKRKRLGEFREEPIQGVSQMVKSENTNNKCNVRNMLDMIYFCFHKSPVANWAKGKTGFSAGTKVVMNILLLGNGIYIKERALGQFPHMVLFHCNMLLL